MIAKRFPKTFFWRPGLLVRNSIALLGWMLLRALAQSATIFLLARMLGGIEYGKFVAIIATASFFTPFIGLGLAHIVLRNGALDPHHLPAYSQYAAYWWAITLIPVIILSIAVSELLLPSDLPRIAAYVAIAAEMGATSMTELYARSRQAVQHINVYGAINAGLPLVRLVALCLLLFHGSIDINTALWTYAAGNLGYLALLAGRLKFRKSRLGVGLEPMRPTTGLPLTLSTFSMRVQGEFNKPALAHLGFDAAGAYNVAQRAMELISMPLLALQESLWPRLYARSDARHTLLVTGMLLLLLATLCGFCIWLVAPLIPAIFGPDFGMSAIIVRQLALLPVLQVIRALLNFNAIRHGRMPLIGWACVIGAVVGVVCMVLLIPLRGVTGAVIAAYTSEVAMIIWLIVGMMSQKRRPHVSE